MRRARAFGGGVAGLGLAVALGVPILAAPDGAPDVPGACAPTLPLVWVAGDHKDAGVLAEAERETARVWAAAGITLRWARSGPARAIRADDLLVVVRSHPLAPHPGSDAAARRRTTLGRLIRPSVDRPGRMIELALSDIEASILHLPVRGRPLRDVAPPFRGQAIGRALGRVLAHEVGHWLFGRDHTPSGLMRASIRRLDLVAEEPPPLPAHWPAAALAQLRTHRPCPVPPVVHQPVTE